MSTVISPFLLNKTRPREEFSSRQNEYFDLLERIAEQLYTRTGGPSDSIEASDFAPMYGINTDPEGEFIPAATTFDAVKFNPVSKSVNYTAQPLDFVNASNGAEITFPLYPDEMSVIIIRNGDGSTIKLNGNGRNINGDSSGKLQRKGTSIQFYYFTQTNEWLAS